MRTNDTPQTKARVRMRVDVKPHMTSLPLAHDEVFNGGSNKVKQGVSEIVVYADDVPSVMAKVETDHAAILVAHEAFWDTARMRTLEGLERAGLFSVKLDDLPSSPLTDNAACNRWVAKNWPADAVTLYEKWISGEALENERSPQARFTALRRRGELPLRSAEVIETTAEQARPPLSTEDKTTSAIMGALGKELVAGMRSATGTPDAENDALKAQVAELTQRLNALAASLGEKPARK